MNYRIFVLSAIFVLSIVSLKAQKSERETNKIVFELNEHIHFQTIDNFSAADAWRMDFIGKNWPENKKNKIADLLFSNALDDDGNPKGMGLTCWRVNIGAGSYENRENNEVTSSWNRTECFLSPQGTYDFSKQAGQQWFMDAARKRDANNFLFFTNSAPYFMTRSGSTLAPDDKSINLQHDKFRDFADFLAITTNHFINNGFNVNYISPLNEPQVEWSTNKWQEGSFATNADAYKLLTELNSAIDRHKVPSKIVFGEVADMKYLFPHAANEAVPDNIIEEFFTQKGKYSLLQFPNVYNCVSAHDYWTAYPVETLVSIRQKIKQALKTAGNDTKFWASEYCILEKNEITSAEPSPEKSINLGLYVARIIHHDLAIANASAWQWWTAVSMGEDSPIQLKPKQGCTNESLKYDGDIHPTKMFWATANYSFFIRPGMKRVAIERKNQNISDEEAATSLMASAYTDGASTVVVLINYENSPAMVSLKNNTKKQGKKYITSINKNVQYTGTEDLSNLTIPAKSIVTIVI
ncbi:MAG: glycoside hydrolase [Bacteroidia bacterium]|nr:glycoside hydrolase [Bacteroidia bacterium]